VEEEGRGENSGRPCLGSTSTVNVPPMYIINLKGACLEIEMGKIWYLKKDLEKLECSGWVSIDIEARTRSYLQNSILIRLKPFGDHEKKICAVCEGLEKLDIKEIRENMLYCTHYRSILLWSPKIAIKFCSGFRKGLRRTEFCSGFRNTDTKFFTVFFLIPTLAHLNLVTRSL